MKPRAPGVLGDGRRGGAGPLRRPPPRRRAPYPNPVAGPPPPQSPRQDLQLRPPAVHTGTSTLSEPRDPNTGDLEFQTPKSKAGSSCPTSIPGLTPPVAPAHSLQPSSCPQPLLAPPPGFLQTCPLPFQLSPLPSGPWPSTPRSGGCTERGGARSAHALFCSAPTRSLLPSARPALPQPTCAPPTPLPLPLPFPPPSPHPCP